MVEVGLMKDEERVVSVGVGGDVDRCVVGVMGVKMKLELVGDRVGVNGGGEREGGFSEDEEEGLVEIVVDKEDGRGGGV